MSSKKKYLNNLNGNIQELKLHYKVRMAGVMKDVDRDTIRNVLKLVDDMVDDIYQHTLSVIDEMIKDHNVYYDEHD